MHQANGDTRLRAACIDHVDLVARRTRCSATRRGGERSKALEGPRYLLHLLLLLLLFLPSYVLLRVLAFLFLAQMYRTEPNRDRRDAREREQNRTEQNGTSEFSVSLHTRAGAPALVYVAVRVRACVFSTRFITELLMLRGHEERVLPCGFFPPVPYLSLSLSLVRPLLF